MLCDADLNVRQLPVFVFPVLITVWCKLNADAVNEL